MSRTMGEINWSKELKLIAEGMKSLYFRIEGENYRSYPDVHLVVGPRCAFWELKMRKNTLTDLQKTRLRWLVERGHRVFLMRKAKEKITIIHYYRRYREDYKFVMRKRGWALKPDTPNGFIVSQMIALTMAREIDENSLAMGMYGLND